MPKPDPKLERLRDAGILNPHPQQIRAPWFQSGEFFDPRDLIQTKYEMLRYVQVGGASKAEAATLFGMSRPTFYQAEAAFAREGLAGLLPKQRGPKGAHKLTADVMALIEQRLQADGSIHARSLAQEIKSALGISVHPRSIERAIARKKKTVEESSADRLPEAAVAHYETLRATFLEGKARPEGLAVVQFHGMMRGLAILLKTPSAPPTTRPASAELPLQRDSALVRLLANLVLHTHSELTHVC